LTISGRSNGRSARLAPNGSQTSANSARLAPNAPRAYLKTGDTAR
jgi:hypothetical protein